MATINIFPSIQATGSPWASLRPVPTVTRQDMGGIDRQIGCEAVEISATTPKLHSSRVNVPPQTPLRSASAFSLVEVVIALGILAFSGVTMLGLLPVAFNSLQSSSFDTIATRISASVRSDLQQTELDGNGKGVRYYDTEGRELDPANLNQKGKIAIYDAYLSEQDYQMPGVVTSSTNYLRRITVQVFHNPARKSFAPDVNGWVTDSKAVPSKTFCFYVVR